MFEKSSNPSAEQYLEIIESRAYTELLQAQERVDLLMQEIKRVFVTTSDKQTAERIILENFVPQLSEAQREANRAIKDWIDSIREQHQLSSQK